LTSNGLIYLTGSISRAALKIVILSNTLIAEENQDRKALYAEIARANGHS